MPEASADPPIRANAAQIFLDRHLTEGRGHRTAHRFQGRGVTYTEISVRANRFGNALRDRGVEAEQRVLLALSDRPEFAEAFWGTLKVGAVAVPVNPGLTAEQYAFLLADSRARLAVVDELAAAQLLAVRERAPWLRAVVAVGRARRGTLPYERLLERASPDLEPADTSRDDVALWGYTSGSTGEPKAALHLHRDLVAAADLVGAGVFGIGADDVVLSVSKLFFMYGLGNSLLFPSRAGAASVLVPERPEAERIFEAIQAERATVLFTVPTFYRRLLAVEGAERRWDLSSLRLCVSSGEALPTSLYHAWKARFGLELHDVVGTTEALHDFLANRPGEVRPGSSGRVIPGFEVKLTDAEGRLVLPGSVGELWVKGETISPGYWNRRELTRRTMVGEWLRTGDMYFQDTDGYFFFCGRSDDMLKVGGMWVSPIEVEGALAAHPAVAEAAVIGRLDTDGLIRAHAFCALRPGVAPSEALAAELRESVKRQLAGYKAPRWVEFVAELPKTDTGKLQRFRLRAGV